MGQDTREFQKMPILEIKIALSLTLLWVKVQEDLKDSQFMFFL